MSIFKKVQHLQRIGNLIIKWKFLPREEFLRGWEPLFHTSSVISEQICCWHILKFSLSFVSRVLVSSSRFVSAFVLKSDSMFGSSVSNSGQNFKTQVSGSWKKKPRKTRFFRVWNECDFER